MLSKLPLLQKELIEYASTKRIYILRIVYGIMIYATFLYFWSKFTKTSNLYTILGNGRGLLQSIFAINITTIYLILPIMSASVIANEKEKHTLQLLFITKLGPSLILIEKFLSLVIFMFCFLFMSFPIVYMTYLLGGLTNANIFAATYIQFLTIIQVAAIGLFFSCYCQSPLKATMGTYICLAVTYILPLCVEKLYYKNNYQEIIFFPPGFYFYRYPNSMWEVPSYTIPIVVFSLFFICVALFLLRNYLRRINKKTTVHKKRRYTPENKTEVRHIERPIVWREGTFRNWSTKVKVFFVLGIIIGVSMLYHSASVTRSPDYLVLVYYSSIAIAFLFLAIKSATLFQSEIKNQTWNVLLTTPLPTKSIFWQKTMVLTRFTVYLYILLCVYGLSVSSTTGYFYSEIPLDSRWKYVLIYTGISLLAIQWSMTWLGLVFRNNKRLGFIAVSLVFTCCALPILLAAFARNVYVASASPFFELVTITNGRPPGFSLYRRDVYYFINISTLLFFGIFIVCAIASYRSQKKIRIDE